MGTLFRDVWLWCLLSFLLGSLITWAVMRATRKPKVEVTQERLDGTTMDDRMGRTGTTTTAAAAGTAGAPRETSRMRDASPEASRMRNAAPKAPGDKATAMAGSGSAMRMVQPGEFPGSARSNADGSAPSPEYTVKGDVQSLLYHTPDSPSYRDMRAEVWFRSTIEAERAGFVAWNRNPRDARTRRA